MAGATTDQAAARKRIDALYGDPDFMKRYASPVREVRQAAMAEMSAVFAAAYPEPAPDGGDGSGAAAPIGGADNAGAGGGAASGPLDRAAALKRVDGLYGNADFMKRYASPVREAAMAEMSAAFETAYPEPAPDSGGAT